MWTLCRHTNLSYLRQKLRSICMCSQGILTNVLTEKTSYSMFFYSGLSGDLQAVLWIWRNLQYRCYLVVEGESQSVYFFIFLSLFFGILWRPVCLAHLSCWDESSAMSPERGQNHLFGRMCLFICGG